MYNIQNMDPNDKPIPKPEIGETVEIALAIAEREQKEIELGRAIISPDYNPDNADELRSEAILDGAARNLLRIEDPDNGEFLLEKFKTEFRAQYEELARIFEQKTGQKLTVEEIEEKVLNYARGMMDMSGQSEEQSATDFKVLFEAAQQVASTYGVSVAEVYGSDELFIEAHRSAYNVEQFAQRYVDMLSGLTVQAMIQVVKNTLIGTAPAGVDEEEYLNILSMSDQFKGTVLRELTKQKRAIGELARAHINRIWGNEEVQQLPDSIKLKLGL